MGQACPGEAILVKRSPFVQGAPVHEHDCERCEFLGNHTYEGAVYDLYFCMDFGKFPTLVARWSSDGPDCYSGLEFGKIHFERQDGHPLAEAYRIAMI